IDTEFKNLSYISPGSIGAHFYGCNIHTPFSDKAPGCSVICAGSMPRKDKFWKSCDNTVILARNMNTGFDFEKLSVGNDKSHAHIFINYDKLEDFPGFTKDEKSELTSMGISKVYLHNYNSNDNNTVPLTENSMEINAIKIRPSPKTSRPNKPNKGHHRESDSDSESDEDNNIWVMWLVAIIVIVIILLIIA